MVKIRNTAICIEREKGALSNMESNIFAKASLTMLRVSPRKLNLVAQLIRGMPVREALQQLNFSKKRISDQVGKCVKSAAVNAENSYGLDVGSLFVKSATVGKAACMKRMHPRAKGRSSQIKKFFSNLYVIVAKSN